jgi:hypothetical protein
MTGIGLAVSARAIVLREWRKDLDMTRRNKISSSLTHYRPPSSGPGRPRLSRAERSSLQILAAVIGFCIYGFATGSPSTIGYAASVLLIAAGIAWLRRDPLPAPLAIALAIAAILDLAGGLINVGQNVLYNASIGSYSTSLGTHYLQYDHLVHAYVSFAVAFACWVMLAEPHAAAGHRRELVILAVGTALGFGGLNEMVEFIATLAHSGAHTGGYWNTGWDLICNFIGAGTAGLIIARSPATAAESLVSAATSA